MDAEQVKMVTAILHASNTPGRQYVYSQDVEESKDMKYNYFEEAMQIRRYVSGEFGTVSDAYILYIVSLLSYATPETVREMLEAYSKSNKMLSIAKTFTMENSEGNIEPRIQKLTKEGNLFRVNYRTDAALVVRSRTVSIYGAPKATQTFVNVKLQKRLPISSFTAAAPLDRIISLAAVSYVAAITANRCGCRLEAIVEKAFKSSELGVIQLPPRLLLKDDKTLYQVLFYPGFLNQVTSYQTDRDFEQVLKNKIQEIKNFFYDAAKRETTMESYCVIVCEDQRDMENMKMVIRQTHVLVDFGNLPRIYITSEGAIKEMKNLQDAFLQMIQTPEEDLMFVKMTPPFIHKK